MHQHCAASVVIQLTSNIYLWARTGNKQSDLRNMLNPIMILRHVAWCNAVHSVVQWPCHCACTCSWISMTSCRTIKAAPRHTCCSLVPQTCSCPWRLYWGWTFRLSCSNYIKHPGHFRLARRPNEQDYQDGSRQSYHTLSLSVIVTLPSDQRYFMLYPTGALFYHHKFSWHCGFHCHCKTNIQKNPNNILELLSIHHTRFIKYLLSSCVAWVLKYHKVWWVVGTVFSLFLFLHKMQINYNLMIT